MKNFNTCRLIVLGVLASVLSGAGAQATLPPFYSKASREREVTFTAFFRTAETDLVAITKYGAAEQDSFIRNELKPTLKYLFGPSTHHWIGNPQRNSVVTVDWAGARLVDGAVELPYTVTGPWILRKDIAAKASFKLPVPLNGEVVFSPNWKECTDSAPDHQTEDFYWYFWDPARSGCDHVEGREYRTVEFTVGAETPNQKETYPEYDKLLKSNGIDNNLQLTFAFGYVEDPVSPSPETDSDSGAGQYRKFTQHVRKTLKSGFVETPILQKEYPYAYYPDLVIGHRFQGDRDGVKVTVNVIIAAGIDQMDLFAKSFAHDHDGFFAWMGHSRVGSGFDASRFGSIVASDPSYYSISTNYQMIYWGGCNSYSYYTLPFFKFKADASNGQDPNGTKGLDIVANGMPSYFSLNGPNSAAMLKHLLNWKNRPSYQTIVNDIEDIALKQGGVNVLAAVLGDEDNAQ